MVRVDFSALPADEKGETKLASKSRFMLTAAEIVWQTAGFDPTDVELNRDAVVWATKAYLILNAAYKDRRDVNGYPRPEKQAALMSAAIMTVRPFRFMTSSDVKYRMSYYADQVYAFSCARRILPTDLSAITPLYQDRAYDYLLTLDMKCLSGLLTDMHFGVNKDVYEVDLETDLNAIDGSMLMFELLLNLQDSQREIGRLKETNRRLEQQISQLRGPLP